MNIFESLENLNVSEECFDSIVDIIEKYINEVSKDYTSPKLVNGENKRKDIEKETDEILNSPVKTEEEKDEAAKRLANYNCKAVNTTNKAFDYEEKKIKKAEIDRKKK